MHASVLILVVIVVVLVILLLIFIPTLPMQLVVVRVHEAYLDADQDVGTSTGHDTQALPWFRIGSEFQL